jgi:flagellar motor switch protein FliN
LANVLYNEVLDRKLEGMEDKFRSFMEQSLTAFLERPVGVTVQGPQPFEFKEFKASLPGEVVCATLVATEGGPGRTLFCLSKDAAAMLGDMLLMGDGKAEFSLQEHIEPVRDLFKEVMASFASDFGKEIGHRVAFDEIKVSVVDLTPSDFVGTGWVISKLQVGLEPPQDIFRIVSMDFCEACFPDSIAHVEAPEAPMIEEPDITETDKEMGLVLDIELPVSIELGRTTMLIRDIVKLAPGSIVELDKLSGEPVDLFVNGRKFARGEVVVVDENFAVRVTELVAPNEPMRSRRN